MEIDISKSNNIISFDKKKNSFLTDDAIFSSKTGSIVMPEEAFHIDQSKYVNLSNFGETKDLKLYINNEILYIYSKETTSEAYLFSMFFNYLKIIYTMNLKNHKFQNYEEIKFNLKEYKTNLKQYARNEIFLELLESLTKNLNHFNLVTEIMGTKLTSFLQEISTLDQDPPYNIKNIISNLKDDYDNVFMNQYSDYIKIFKERSDDDASTGISSLSLNKSNTQNMMSCDVILNNLDEVKQNNLLLRKFMLEISKAFFFEIIKFYDSENSINYSNNYIFSYFINENSFGFDEEESQIMKHEGKKLEILKERYTDISNECLNLKKSLREIIYDRNIFPFFCFKCGNLMKRKSNTTPSTCKIDNKCTNQSSFYCYKCKIDFCNYCIKEVKDGKCGNGHLMFKFGNISDKSCVNCLSNIHNECYMCNLCEVAICINCYENINSIPFKCEKCKCHLLWKRSTLNFCEKCNDFSQNFWDCFFCENSYCAKCYSPIKNYCGAAHLLEEIDLNNLSTAEYTKNFSKPNSDLYCQYHIMNYSCSYCSKTTIPKFSYCKRCHFNKCESCSSSQE